MSPTNIPVLSILLPQRVVIPIVVGLSVAAYTFLANLDVSRFSSIVWTINSVVCIAIAILLMGVIDFTYISN
jgi:hypothetical protein